MTLWACKKVYLCYTRTGSCISKPQIFYITCCTVGTVGSKQMATDLLNIWGGPSLMISASKAQAYKSLLNSICYLQFMKSILVVSGSLLKGICGVCTSFSTIWRTGTMQPNVNQHPETLWLWSPDLCLDWQTRKKRPNCFVSCGENCHFTQEQKF